MSEDNGDGNDNVSTHYNPRLAQWTGRARLAPAYKRSRGQERDTAKSLKGGRLIPASGAKFRKADVEVVNLARVECKATGAKSFSVTREMIRKVEDAGLMSNQIPYLEIEFVDNKGKTQESACVISRHALTILLNRLADAEGITPTDRRSLKNIERNARRLTKK